jgi:hypothetical protein
MMGNSEEKMRQPKSRLFAIGFIVVAVVAGSFALAPSRSSAGSLSTGVIGMFPKQIGEFGYADLKSARKYAWFPKLREQLLPSKFRQFEQFLTSAGVDPSTQVEELAWGGMPVSKAGGEDVVGVALGAFDPSSTEARFKAQKLPSVDFHGYHLWAYGSGSGAGDILFTFIDNNTAAFGHRAALEQLIDVRMGGAPSLLTNDQLFPLINEVNGSGIVWGVLDQNYTHLATQQLLPESSQFPQAAAIVDRLKAMTINVDADSGVNVKFQAVCNSTDDANLLGAAFQAGLMYKRYQTAQTNPDLAKVLDGVSVVPAGDRLKVEAGVSEAQLGALISSKVFAVPM